MSTGSIASMPNLLINLGFEEIPTQKENTEVFFLTQFDIEKIESMKKALFILIQAENLDYSGAKEDFVSDIQQKPYLVKFKATLQLASHETVGDIYNTSGQKLEALGYYFLSRKNEARPEVQQKINVLGQSLDSQTKNQIDRIDQASKELLDAMQSGNQEKTTLAKFELALIAYKIAKKHQSYIHYKRAIELFNSVIHRNEDHPSFNEKVKIVDAYTKMAKIYEKANDLETALSYRYKAIELGKNNIEELTGRLEYKNVSGPSGSF